MVGGSLLPRWVVGAVVDARVVGGRDAGVVGIVVVGVLVVVPAARSAGAPPSPGPCGISHHPTASTTNVTTAARARRSQ